MLGGHRDVRLEFARPPALDVLALQQPADGAFERALDVRARHRRLGSLGRAGRFQAQAARRRLTAANRRFHRVGPAGIGPRAGDRQARMRRLRERARAAQPRQVRCLRIARHGAARQIRLAQLRKKGLRFAPGQRLELRGRQTQILVGRAETGAQVPRPLLEDPLQRRFERRGKFEPDRAAVVPKVDVNDRIGFVRIQPFDAVRARIPEHPLDLTGRNREHDRIEASRLAVDEFERHVGGAEAHRRYRGRKVHGIESRRLRPAPDARAAPSKSRSARHRHRPGRRSLERRARPARSRARTARSPPG